MDCLAQQTAVESTGIHDFIRHWKDDMSRKVFYWADVHSSYADSVNWYNQKLSGDSLGTIVKANITLSRTLTSANYSIAQISPAPRITYMVHFDDADVMITCGKHHYLIVEQQLNGRYKITSQSSLADDAWYLRKKQIASSTIEYRKKKYYILRTDSFAFRANNTVIYFLTDTLKFHEPQSMDVCYGIRQLAYTATGNIFVAMGNPVTGKISSMSEITREFNEPDFANAQLIYGGFPLLIARDTITPQFPAKSPWWTEPGINWTPCTPSNTYANFYLPYIYGSECRVVRIFVLLKRKGLRKYKIERELLSS